MWRPPQRIKWTADPGPWPSREEAEASLLFAPVQVGGLTLEQRSWVPAMVPWRATADGFVTPAVLDLYGRFARGRPGAMVVEATGIRDIPSGPLLRLGDDRFVAGMRDLVETVRAASDGETRLFIQLIDFLAIRRRPDPEKYFGRFLVITDRHRKALGAEDWPEAKIRTHLADLDDAALDAVLSAREREALRMGYRERVTDTHLEHVRELPRVLPDDSIVPRDILWLSISIDHRLVDGERDQDADHDDDELAEQTGREGGLRVTRHAHLPRGGRLPTGSGSTAPRCNTR